SLPGLACVDASRCVGPNLQRRPVRLIQHRRPSKREFNPAIADCGLQGTATSPSSTAKASGGDKGPSASLAPSAARSTYREYASRAAFRRRLVSGPFSPPDKVAAPSDVNTIRTREDGGGGGIRTHGTVARTRHFQCRTFGHSATPPLRPPKRQPAHHAKPQIRHTANLAEGRGFEPPRDLRPYPISSRTPSTGLGHPSASLFYILHNAGHRGEADSPQLV